MKVRISNLCLISFFTFFAMFSEQCWAGFFDDIKNTVGDVVGTGWKATTAPYEAVLNAGKVITGSAKPAAILQPYQELGRAVGGTAKSATNLVAAPQKEIYKRVQKLASKTGVAGEFIFDVGTFNQQFFQEFTVAGVNSLDGILRGQNPLQLTAVPLAGAIRAAREKHLPNAKPLPADVKKGLAKSFSNEILSRAKFVVGKVDITLPNFIGKGAKFFGDDYAVVVDDIIVFNTTPPSFSNSPFWWAHEVMHVEQYKRLGVESFAFNYIRDLGVSIEAEADNKAISATGKSDLVDAALLASKSSQIGMQVEEMPTYTHSSKRPVPEYFVSQCFFPYDVWPVHYLVTNTGKIIAIDPKSGNWLQVGWATPPLAPGVAWSYQTPYFRYAVLPSGAIMTTNQFGQYLQIGHVVRL